MDPSHLFPFRAAGIDVGSNALRLLAAEFTAPGKWRTLSRVRLPVRLGATVFGAYGALAPETMAAALDALVSFRRALDELGIRDYRAAATSAVREAANGRALVHLARQRAGIDLEPITAAEEARVVWQAVRTRMRASGRFMLVDVGGGSVEMACCEDDRVTWTRSYPVGTVRLLAHVGGAGDSPRAFRHQAEQHIAMTVKPPDATAGCSGLVATGGNIEALARLAGVRGRKGIAHLESGVLRELIDTLADLTPAERRERFGLRHDRADVVLPAALAYERVASITGAVVIMVPHVGLREGLLLDTLARATARRRNARP